ncbi:Ribosomal L18p/L5e family protein [Forsythia ovata]|uniref:Ribosomal L18p/L5e family protein n=1 Tax=Forsythia ovata TaxID=205694 RepID=A0ABD1T923_9LAMI
MASTFFRRVTTLKAIVNCQSFSFSSSRVPTFLLGNVKGDSITNYSNRLHLSPLFSDNKNEVSVNDCEIELVDDETWQVSSGIADMWRGNDERKALEAKPFSDDQDGDYNGVFKFVDLNKGSPDYDEIEDMRIRGSLFYKLDKGSKEYDEYKYDFHGTKHSKNQKENKKNKEKEDRSCMLVSKVEKMSQKNELKEIKKNKVNKVDRLQGIDKNELKEFEKNKVNGVERLQGIDKNEYLISHLHELGDYFVGKMQRTPTFNQLTAPYHEPFCLDIYISKGSVRASIIHRVTSKVVEVAHSISKDMKFDLGSTKNRNACAAVGEVLAQRALADDIHNVVYTPRKGEKLEGKLQIVLKSIVDNGIDVKVKLKPIKSRKTRSLALRAQQ